jgi:hypothetical protein
MQWKVPETDRTVDIFYFILQKIHLIPVKEITQNKNVIGKNRCLRVPIANW